jgi:integrase
LTKVNYRRTSTRGKENSVAKVNELTMARAIAGPKRVEAPGPVQGLVLRGRNGKGAWLWRRMVNGRRLLITLGEFPAVPMAEAVKRATEINATVDAGGDVITAGKRAAKTGLTVKEGLDRYATEVLAKKRSGRAMAQVLALFWQPMLDRRVGTITPSDVGKRYNQRRAKSPEAARLGVAYSKPFWGWLTLEGETAFPVIEIKLQGAQKRERVPSLEELGAIWRATEAEAELERSLVQTLMLTGLRRDEIGGLRRDEVDLAAGLLRLPSARMKGKRPFDVPLAPAAVSLLAAALRATNGDLVFPTRTGTRYTGWTRLKDRLSAASGVEDWTFHDFRRSISTILPDRGLADAITCDLMLAHRPTGLSGASAHYFKSALLDQRRAAAVAWAELIRDEVAKQAAKAPKLAVVG